MQHWLAGFLGLDDPSGHGYLFWSGTGSDLAYMSFLWAGLILYRRHNCRQKWCWRIGRYGLTDPETSVTRLLCHKHHPDRPARYLSPERIADIQRRRHLYLGARPGRG